MMLSDDPSSIYLFDLCISLIVNKKEINNDMNNNKDKIYLMILPLLKKNQQFKLALSLYHNRKSHLLTVSFFPFFKLLLHPLFNYFPHDYCYSFARST